MNETTEVFGRLAIRGPPRLCIVLHKYLRTVPLALGDHAHVEAGVKELAGGELAEGEDRAVERKRLASLAGRFPALGRRDGEGGPTLAPSQGFADLPERQPTLGRWTDLGRPGRRILAE